MIGLSAAVFVAFATGYAMATPFGQAPDERAHFGYLQLIAQHLQLPVAIPERQQPPLYYLLAAILYRLTGSIGVVQAISILCGAATVGVIGLCARELWPGQPRRWVIGSLPAATLPQFQFIAASVSNDALAVLAAAILTLLMIRILVRPPDRHLAWAIGLAFALTLLAKETAYFLIVVVLFMLARFWPRRQWLPSLVPVVALPTVLAGWWFVRNLTTFARLVPPFTPLYTDTPTKLSSLSQVSDWLYVTFLSFFALLGNMSTQMPPSGSSLVYELLLAAAVVIFVCGVVTASLRWRTWSPRQRWMATACIVVPLLALLQMVISSIAVDYQPQGRYLFVAGPLLALGTVFVIEPLAANVPRWVGVTVGAVLLVGLLGLDVAGLYAVWFNLVRT
jgi:4-amino-4-deoxy-L-arabinose transferase-like glycosyltransferase